MTCDDALRALHDRLDGEDVSPELDAHLAACEPCRALAEDLGRLQLAARQLPREVQPSRDLWPEIRARVAPARRLGWSRPLLLAAALLLVAIGSSALTALALRPPPTTTVAAAEWEQDLDVATAELRAEVDRRRGELDPETVAVVDQNLRIIDQAVAETRAALSAHPTDAALQRALADAGEQRIALLRHVLTLPRNG